MPKFKVHWETSWGLAVCGQKTMRSEKSGKFMSTDLKEVTCARCIRYAKQQSERLEKVNAK